MSRIDPVLLGKGMTSPLAPPARGELAERFQHALHWQPSLPTACHDWWLR